MKCPICGHDFAGPLCNYHTAEEWMKAHQAALDAEFGPGSYVLVEPKAPALLTEGGETRVVADLICDQHKPASRATYIFLAGGASASVSSARQIPNPPARG